MDFFEAQHQAKKRTALLVGLFSTVVVIITAAVYFAVFFTLDLTGLTTEYMEARQSRWFDPSLTPLVILSSLAIMAIGSLTRTLQLRGGGSTVALMLGGELVADRPDDPKMQRLLNVVEEMAIASGVPVPATYILPEETSINAFAAGHSLDDAAIGVTRGAVDQLSRDELQGVVAHEFSHILNGDMKLNIRLLGLLNGILMFYVLGSIFWRFFFFFLFPSQAESRYGRSSRRGGIYFGGSSGGRSRGGGGGKGGGGGAIIIAIVVLSTLLVIIGLIGLFFARLIQSAISRQREYLADSAAVQFTRNSDGIAGALKKIGGLHRKSYIRNDHAEEAGHLFFGRVAALSLGGLTNTHPPLKKRIRAIDPSFDGQFPKVKIIPTSRPKIPDTAYEPVRKKPKTKNPPVIRPEVLMAGLGILEQSQLERAQNLLEKIPRLVRQATHDLTGARAVVYFILFHPEGDTRTRQMDLLKEKADPTVFRELTNLLPHLSQLSPEQRLPVIDLCLPVLRQLSPDQWIRFHDNINLLIEADQQVSLFEFCVKKIVFRQLGQHFKEGKAGPPRYFSINALNDEISILLSTLSYEGEKDTRKAFGAALGRAGGLRNELQLLPKEECTMEKITEAVDKVADSILPIRQRVLECCVYCAVANHDIAPGERQLLRAIAEAFALPAPSVL
ncbi:MAG: M48 family metallopeptidase [Opitutales bacterium]|nr:M48 family metallopeptidase [Opitutales bacterium]MCH8540145.1 M48 family metallopeptidase [Opitutales bacterium]